MVMPLKYKPEMCAIAEEVLSNGESLAAICAELNIGRTTLYEWRDSNPEFRNAIERGLQKAQRRWERIGMDGIEGHYEKFNAAPWIFTMKNRFRADYQEDKEAKTESTAIIEKLIDKLAE
jgi:hypothetical protein